MSPRSALIFLVISLTTLSSSLMARTRTVGMVPDPSCRSSKLVVPVEDVLGRHLRAPGLKLERNKPEKAQLLLQYFVSVHRDGGNIFVQLDASVVGRRNGRLYGEGSLRSDAFSDDDAGRSQAAQQAAQRLGERLSEGLRDTLSRPGRARRIMLQVSFHKTAASARERVPEVLRKSLKGMSLRERGSTPRNLMLTMFSTEGTKDLVEQIEDCLKKDGHVRVTWQVQSKTTLMLEVRGAKK